MPQRNQYDQPIGAPLPEWQPVASPPAVTLCGRFCQLDPLQLSHSTELFAAFSLAPDDREWPPIQQALSRWLAAENMDNNGREHQKLRAFFTSSTPETAG